MTGSTPLHTVRVRILGKDVPIRTALPEEHVRRVEQYVTERLERFSAGAGSADTLLVATLALMHLAEECLALRAGNAVLDSEDDERLGRIVERLGLEW